MDKKVDAQKMLKGTIERFSHNDSLDNWDAIMTAVDDLFEVRESEKDETGGKYDQLIKRLAELTEITKGNINQRLQVILSTAQNCRKEIELLGSDEISIIKDTDRIVDNVKRIVRIMNGEPEELERNHAVLFRRKGEPTWRMSGPVTLDEAREQKSSSRWAENKIVAVLDSEFNGKIESIRREKNEHNVSCGYCGNIEPENWLVRWSSGALPWCLCDQCMEKRFRHVC